MSMFSAVEMAPRDPILGLNEQFSLDSNPQKVNLGVGVYYDDNGKLPLLACVQKAEQAMMDKPSARGYLPIDGIAAYDAAVQTLVFGADSVSVKAKQVATVQCLGGTGGLKVGADFLAIGNSTSAAHYLIYNPSSGKLSFDADGNMTKSKPIEVAFIGTGLSMTSADILIV